MKSNLLKFTAVGAFVISGLLAACSDVHTSDVPNDDPTVGGGSSGRGGHAGSTSSAGSSNEAGEPAKLDAGAAGGPEAADAGAGGQLDSAENGGNAASASGTGGGGAGAGASTAASGAGGAGAGGAGVGGAGAGGAGANTGGFGVGGANSGGGGSAGTAGSVAAAGAAGAPLVLPASATCAAGNVKAAFSVCRNCHVDFGAAPFPLVTLADIVAQADEIVIAIGGRALPATMPQTGTLGKTNKDLILAWIAAGAQGVPVASCP